MTHTTLKIGLLSFTVFALAATVPSQTLAFDLPNQPIALEAKAAIDLINAPVVQETTEQVETTKLTLAIEEQEQSFHVMDFTQFPVALDDFRHISQRFTNTHNGLDIAAKLYAEIHPVQSGTVVVSEYTTNGYGNYIVVEHENGLRTLYGHMNKRFVAVGDKVDYSTVMGTVGLTGRTTGPHIHFEVLRTGKNINPALILAIPEKE